MITATDPDGVAKFNTLTYSLTGTDASKFNIGSSTGQITVKTGNIPDYEAKTSYSVTVNVTDGKNASGTADTTADDTIAVTINVTDENEPPAAPAAPTVTLDSTTPASKIDVSWTAPSMTGKPAIDGYDVRYRKTGDSAWSFHVFSGVVTAVRSSDGTTATVSWTEYDGSDFDYYRVIVCTAANFTTAPSCSSPVHTGSAISSSSTTTESVSGLTAATGYGVILQVWRDDGTSLKLHVSMAADSNGATSSGTPALTGTSTSIGSLTSAKSHEVQVRARNDEGTGAWSASGSAITRRPEASRAPSTRTRTPARTSARR